MLSPPAVYSASDRLTVSLTALVRDLQPVAVSTFSSATTIEVAHKMSAAHNRLFFIDPFNSFYPVLHYTYFFN